ncbi:DNA topoisomerase I [Kosmotoga arenicorallina S304]|uniref:DNA topoisomerase 1 n=1 Tax=Kosmotoga arenicorallina S304 TaxID=1453497 RepID=A0A176K204_9BACT|nr:type I DNA topoisomerase [Kosmotoga arenicorallina]OAA31204.1 DNA topoisomerase I [Kosmotoga arenicorallina S304]
MSKTLVIVESPAKAKTIARYLGNGYEVASSKGHVRDLPASDFGVDLETFEPSYEILKNKTKVVNELKRLAKGKRVLLASDMDREGEAIAWHLSKILNLPEDEKNRVIFSEITEKVIKDAVKSPRKIDSNKVNAQVARRILDRIVGYKLSPLLWKSLKRGLSAGRVQSVALRFIVELESKRAAFKPHSFYKIFLEYKGKKIPLIELNGKKFNNRSITSPERRTQIIQELSNITLYVKDQKKRKSIRKPPAPFITSTLQQASINELGWSASKTMKIAQQLYEGVETPEGTIAFITYMRTDSTRISTLAQEKARSVIREHFGKEFVGSGARSKKAKNVQDAHEAIRPTYPEKSPERVKQQGLLNGDHLKLYNLIWNRFIASQMAAAEYEVIETIIADEKSKYIFKYTKEAQLFAGFEKLYPKRGEKESLNINLPVGSEFKADKVIWEEDKTTPPARFTEASLVKELEKKGIGRPSTYATIISTLLDRKYVVKQKRELVPTILGNIVADFLSKGFPEIIDERFTATMESELDEIEKSKKEWKEIIREFYDSFAEDLSKITRAIRSGELKLLYPTDKRCLCGGEMNIVFGRYGGYLKCSACGKNEKLNMELTAPLLDGRVLLSNHIDNAENKETLLEEKCPECGSPLVTRNGKYGKFIACSSYPKCKYTRNVTIDAPCPNCGGEVAKLRSKKGKTYFKCTSCGELFWNEPAGKSCPECGKSLVYLTKKGGKKILYCESCKKEIKE